MLTISINPGLQQSVKSAVVYLYYFPLMDISAAWVAE